MHIPGALGTVVALEILCLGRPHLAAIHGWLHTVSVGWARHAAIENGQRLVAHQDVPRGAARESVETPCCHFPHRIGWICRCESATVASCSCRALPAWVRIRVWRQSDGSALDTRSHGHSKQGSALIWINLPACLPAWPPDPLSICLSKYKYIKPSLTYDIGVFVARQARPQCARCL